MVLHLTAQGCSRVTDGHSHFLRLVALPLIKAASTSISSSNKLFSLHQNQLKNHPRALQKTAKMKIFSLFFTLSLAIEDFLLFSLLGNSGSDSQSNQMNSLLPLLLMSDNNSTSDNSGMLMMMMMSGGTGDMNQLLPLLLLGDDSGDTDMLSTFMLLSTIQGDCNTNTNNAMSNLLPLLLFADDGSSQGSSSDSLMTMLLFSTMSGGEGMSFETLMMLDLFSEDRKRRSSDSEMDDVLMMVLLSSMSGGMNSQSGFDNSFNLLLPMLLMNDTETDSSSMLVLMMAMQSAAPGSGMGSNMLLPLMLMDDSGSNEDLMFYMMMFGGGNTGSCNKGTVELPPQIFLLKSFYRFFPGMSNRSGSVTSGRSNGKYRLRSKTSEVDELLFGGPNKGKQPRSANRKPEVLQVITKDLIRNVIVPQEKADRTILLEKSMAQHIEEKSSVKSKETIRAEMDMARKEKNDAITAAAQRKERFKEIDIHRKKSQALNEIDLEAKRINEHLLENAKAKRLEQEDEIKHLNELILNAKCHAIRDAQILERDIIQKEEMEDDARCDRISEVHRLNCIQDAENKKTLMTAKRIEGAQQIMDQIRRNEEARILEEERKNAEQANVNRYIAK
ncbi:unnamed protein product [Oikopleura dioica]|uniref:Cilia- and flagella-associated protein 45 n=1 Tax=Oikopleura dioica TaxID=34765 RepID=E4X544_OIKDI|nr:unnamed protein product [Oikopleura dioica]